MKTINLFFDFEFTSLSPDAQPISLGIVSEEINTNGATCFVSDTLNSARILAKEFGFNPWDDNCCVASKPEHLKSWNISQIYMKGDISSEMLDAVILAKKTQMVEKVATKSFYSEFSDFDINRCDDWVKENVVSKLKMYSKKEDEIIEHLDDENYQILSITQGVKIHLKNWLSQFSDYQIQFICDCCTWDWWFMVQLLAEWDNKFICQSGEYKTREEARCKGCYAWDCRSTNGYSMGLPKLPDNISPVSFDLNDLIAIKKGITPKEAFELNREELIIKRCLLIDKEKHQQDVINSMIEMYRTDGTFDSELAQELKSDMYCQLRDKYKHNALFDAKVIKEIYNKLH